MEFWNQKILNPPANCSFHDKNHQIDVRKLNQHLQDTINKQCNQDSLDAEAALVSRCIYRMKLKFRKDKGLKALEKVNRGLKQYLELNMLQVITSFHKNVPKNKEIEAYLPTRNLLDYLLVRILGLTKLCVRIAEVSKECAAYMENKIAIGHFWKVAIISMAVSSRIWFFAKEIANTYCSLYEYLLPIRIYFQNTGINWLPDTFEFPNDIRLWSGFNVFMTPVTISKKVTETVLKLDEDSDSETAHNIIDLVNINENSNDVGELLTSKKTMKNKKTFKATENSKSGVERNISTSKQIMNMKSFKEITTFINEENYIRKTSKKGSSFKNVNDQKWEKILQFIKKHEQKGTLESIEKSKKLLKAALKE